MKCKMPLRDLSNQNLKVKKYLCFAQRLYRPTSWWRTWASQVPCVLHFYNERFWLFYVTTLVSSVKFDIYAEFSEDLTTLVSSVKLDIYAEFGKGLTPAVSSVKFNLYTIFDKDLLYILCFSKVLGLD